MSIKACVAVLAVLSIRPSMAFADDDPAHRCLDLSIARDAVISHKGAWSEVTPEPRQFLRGVHAINPESPAGPPYGASAALARVDGYAGGFVFFIDGNQACAPIRAPPGLLALMHEVGSGAVNHPGAGL